MKERELSVGLRAVHLDRTKLPDVSAVHQHVLAIPIQETPQQRGWVPSTGRFQSMFSATKFVVAGVIVALFGGFLLAGVLTTPQDEVAAPGVGASPSLDSTSVRPLMLPAEIPANIRSGVLDTPLGPARWVHLDGNEALQDLQGTGDPGLFVSTSAGFAIMTRFNHGEIMKDARIWQSDDLLSWTSAPAPATAVEAKLSWTDGTFWLATAEPNSLWRSSDAEDWTEVDVATVTPPDAPGLEWQARVGTPVSSGSTTIVPVRFEAQNTAAYLGLSGQGGTCASLHASEGSDVYAENCSHDLIARLNFEETEVGLRVIDAEDGTVYSELEGVDLGLIDGWLAQRRGLLVGTTLGLVDSDRLTSISSPMPRFAPLRLAGDNDGFTAYQLDTADGQPRVWQSADGNAWAEVEPLPGFVLDDPSQEADQQTSFGGDDSARVAGGTVLLMGGDPQPIEGVGTIYPIASLLVMVDGQPGIATIDVAHLGLTTEGWRASPMAISGNTVVLAQERYWDESPGQQHEAWIITFDDLPA